eukprot:TRINITY_DN12003_c0_g3_i1.p2 TRINITY_DN12003_c0_g3~~TRINITY_DN12003_c0_g3_i1.p2  ORF type:complete len:205 (+),score=-14.42 TRINITY_DN12003_c0_g3_i1:237-851(+)
MWYDGVLRLLNILVNPKYRKIFIHQIKYQQYIQVQCRCYIYQLQSLEFQCRTKIRKQNKYLITTRACHVSINKNTLLAQSVSRQPIGCLQCYTKSSVSNLNGGSLFHQLCVECWISLSNDSLVVLWYSQTLLLLFQRCLGLLTLSSYENHKNLTFWEDQIKQFWKRLHNIIIYSIIILIQIATLQRAGGRGFAGERGQGFKMFN